MECFESSIFLRYSREIRQAYLSIEEKINSVYLSSFTHRLITNSAESIKIGFRFSIFGHLTEVEQDASKNFFETSKAIGIALNGMRNFKNKAFRFSATSGLVTSIGSLKCDFFSKPLKVGGIATVIAIVSNVVLSIILQKSISLWGWLMRGLLLFIGISGLFCNTGWPTLRTNSIFFKKRGRF